MRRKDRLALPPTGLDDHRRFGRLQPRTVWVVVSYVKPNLVKAILLLIFIMLSGLVLSLMLASPRFSPVYMKMHVSLEIGTAAVNGPMLLLWCWEKQSLDFINQALWTKYDLHC